MRSDGVRFADRLLPKKPHHGLDGKSGQALWLRSSTQPVNVLVPGNRYGKSTVIAMKHIHKCMFKLGFRPSADESWLSMPYETISAAHSADQALIVFRQARQLLGNSAMKPWVRRIRESPFPHIIFNNGAVFHSRSAHDGGKYLDGHEYRYVSIDEAGYIDDLKGLINGVILMRMAGGGQLDLIGTPKGRSSRGLWWYANRGLRGAEGYYAQRGSIFDNPHLSPADLRMRDEMLRHSDPRIREQVLYGAFISDEGLAFTDDQLTNSFDSSLPAHQDYIPGHNYVQGWDLGRQTDWTVGVTLDVTVEPWVQVDFVRLRREPWETIYSLIESKKREYQVREPRIDATGPQGDVIEEELAKRGIFVDAYKTNTRALKVDLINTLQTVFDHGREVIGERHVLDEAGILMMVPDHEAPGVGEWGMLRMPAIPEALDEFGVYQIDDKDLTQDVVMSVALAAHYAWESVGRYEPLIGGGLYG